MSTADLGACPNLQEKEIFKKQFKLNAKCLTQETHTIKTPEKCSKQAEVIKKFGQPPIGIITLNVSLRFTINPIIIPSIVSTDFNNKFSNELANTLKYIQYYYIYMSCDLMVSYLISAVGYYVYISDYLVRGYLIMVNMGDMAPGLSLYAAIWFPELIVTVVGNQSGTSVRITSGSFSWHKRNYEPDG